MTNRQWTIHDEAKPWRQLLGAICQLAVRDAQRGCPDAARWLRSIGVTVDVDSIDSELLTRKYGNGRLPEDSHVRMGQ